MARKRRARGPVSKKISILRHEGIDQDQAVAMALNMNREGRLTAQGGYKRVGSRGRRHPRSQGRT